MIRFKEGTEYPVGGHRVVLAKVLKNREKKLPSDGSEDRKMVVWGPLPGIPKLWEVIERLKVGLSPWGFVGAPCLGL